MNVRTYEHTYHYLLSKVLFKYGQKLVCKSVRVYVSTYVCISMIVYGTLYQYSTVGYRFCQNHFLLHFNLKNYYVRTYVCTYIRLVLVWFWFGFKP